MRQFTRDDAAKSVSRERREIDGIVCPDYDGSLSFTVKEPSAKDLLRMAKAGEEYGSGGAPIAMVAACVVGPDGNPVFDFDTAAEFVLGNAGKLEPLFQAINDVGVSAIEEPADGSPLQ